MASLDRITLEKEKSHGDVPPSIGKESWSRVAAGMKAFKVYERRKSQVMVEIKAEHACMGHEPF